MEPLEARLDPLVQGEESDIEPSPEGYRSAFTHSPSLNEALAWTGSNRTTTAKYTAWNFVPKNLFEQFRRLANIYFLIIGLIQSLTGLSPTGRYNTLIPLVIVISVNALRELYEDVKRHRLDHADNTRAARVLRAGESAVQSVTWATVQVGDIVVVSEGEEFPADLLLLAAESAPGVSAHDCFVETANLDGESTFKIRQVARLHAPDEGKRAAGARAARLTGMEVASQQLELDQLGTARVRADFEPPCNQLYTLVGRLAPCDEGGAFTAVPAAFSMQSMLLRGMTLRNTHAVYGLVLYTGADLRSVRNSVATPSKRSSVEKQIDKAVLIIFVCLLVLCVVAWTLAHVESELDGDRAWYVPVDGGESGPSAEWTLLVTDLILFNNLVPISLYVTVEVIKLAMSREIEADARMGELPSGKRASSRTSNLHEDLGQVQYVFTDKTGTLTMNEMVFARCSINGVVYGAPLEADAADERADAAARAPRPPPSPRGGEDEAVPFDSTALRRAYAAGGAAAERIDEFMTIVATCHAALPVRADGRSSVAEGRKERPSDREWAEGELSFKAASPDEGALLLGAAEAGWACESALRQQLLVRVHGEPRGYEVLALNVFSATRKRMSVLLLEEATGRLLVCCKGADDTMLELVCTDDADAAAVATPPKRPAGGAARVGSGGGGGGGGDRRELHRAATLSHLLEFATTGLRTLVFAIGYPSEEEASRWLAQFHEASMAGEGREERLDAVAARLETGLRLVGVSAVEDRLQPGVPQTIEALQRGGIHIWMLTGDKVETAINVATAARLIDLTNPLLVISSPEQEGDKARGASDEAVAARSASGLHARLNELEQYLVQERARARVCSLVIDGRSLAVVLESEALAVKLLKLTNRCSATIVARVSPIQKALAIRLVRTHSSPAPLTLAIGDGANDVAMIQEADVGIGVHGVEGTQATRASDYSIGQFRFLARLLLVHGRNNYRRISVTFLYSFYKNVTMVLTLFWFMLDSRFTGAALYEGYLMSGFNVFFTALPILAFGVFEQDLSPGIVARHPELYLDGQRSTEMNPGRILAWLFDALLHAIVLYFGGTACLGGYQRTGFALDHGVHGTCINALLVLAVSAKLWLQTLHWVWPSYACCGVAIALWPIFVAVYSVVGISSPSAEFWNFNDVGTRAMEEPTFWLTLLLVPPTALAVDYVRSHVRAAYWPTPRQILMEIDRGLDKPRRPFRWRELFDWQAFAPRVAPPSRRSTSRSGRRQSGAEAFAQAMGAEGYERPRPASAPWEHVRRNSTANATGTAASTGAAAHEGDGGGGVRGGDDLAKLLLRREQLAFEASIEAILQEERGAKQPKPKRAKPRTRAFRGGAPMPAALGAAYDGWFWLVDQLALLLPPPAQVGAVHRAQRMHPLLLHFEDRSLEDSYMVSFVAGNYRLYTFSMAAWILIIAVHLGVGVAVPLTEGVALSRNGILTLLALAGMMGFFACYIAWLRLSALPRRHFEALNAITTVLIGYGLLFALSQARALVMLVFPVIAHVVCGVRWKYLVCIVLPHHPVFVGIEAFGKGRSEELLTFYWVIIFATMALVGRAVETRERNDFVLQQRLEQTKQRNDAILDNMLPRHVNEQRKRGAAVIANLEPSVSVLFCDVQDFKQIVKENSPAELIRLLDSLYSAMDVVSDELQVTKMETVGYTYMACAGLQGAPASAKGHAYDAIRMAFELLRIANDARGANGRRIVVRIGINSGQVLSGVVGDSKPQYCLFGDTVNTAARMQAKGERMEVHISSRTREELAQAGVDDEFDFVQRTVVAKGLGELTTFLVRKKGDPGASALLALADEADEASQLGALVGPAQPPKDAPPARNGRRQLSITLGSERKPFGRFLKSDATGGAETSPPMRRARATTSAFVRTGAHAAQACGWAEPSAADSPPAVAPDCPQPQPAQQPAQVPRLDLKGKFFRRKTGESSASDLGAGPATPGAASSGQQTPRVLTIMPEEQRRREDNEIASTMRRWDLRFLGDDELLEAVFERSHALYSLREMRVVLFIFAIGQMGFVVLEGVIALAGNPLKRNSAYVAIACACMLLVATAMTTIMPVTESALRMSASKAAAITHVRHTAVVVYAIYGALVPIAQLVKDEKFGTNSSALLIFSAALLSSAGGTRFLEVFFVCFVWFVSWSACGGAGAFLLNVGIFSAPARPNSGRSDSTSGSEVPGLQTLITLFMATIFAVIYSSYVGEYSRRRLMILLYRMHKELVRTDELLHNMMPVSVVAKLKEKVQVADQLNGVLLLYSDVAGFTSMCNKCTPTQVISMLKHLYTIFDALVVQHDLFKVCTIGDAYIIMSNVDSTTASGRSESGQAAVRKAETATRAMLQMAFEMVKIIGEYEAPHGEPLRMRIGVHYGTVAAGVIGTKKLRYDIFGTDALLGNALESNGITGGVVVSEAVLPLMSGLLDEYAISPHELVRLVEGNEFIGEAMSYQVQQTHVLNEAREASGGVAHGFKAPAEALVPAPAKAPAEAPSPAPAPAPAPALQPEPPAEATVPAMAAPVLVVEALVPAAEAPVPAPAPLPEIAEEAAEANSAAEPALRGAHSPSAAPRVSIDVDDGKGTAHGN